MDGLPDRWVLDDAPVSPEPASEGAAFDTPGTPDVIVRSVARALGAEVVLLGVLDPSQTDVDVLATWGGATGRGDPVPPLGAAVGFVARALGRGRAAREPVDSTDPSFGPAVSERPITHGVGVAIRPPNGTRGALWAGFSGAPPPDLSAALWLTDSYAGVASLCLHDREALAGLGGGSIDGLTGCLTHAAFLHELAREIHRADRHGLSLSCCFIDLDRFKRVNDRYGHLHGSRVLANLAAVLRAGVRSEDSVGRYGGDEFVLLLPDTDEPAARGLAQRLRLMITTTMINLPHDPVDASIGVAQWRTGQTGDALLADADGALLRAKEAGGGLVVRAGEIERAGNGAMSSGRILEGNVAAAGVESCEPVHQPASIAELTVLERALLTALAAGPRTPVALQPSGTIPTIARALVWLEHLGLVRMAGSNDSGTWALTSAGRWRL
jgi:diguanylate cyclase (GGDEF)-like protein